jgi:hypothetical protein
MNASARTASALLPWLAATAFAAPLPPAARAEVDALLGRLQASGCEFNRNGSWYAGADAKAHLLKKLDYLEGKDLVKTAEQFIERQAVSRALRGQGAGGKCQVADGGAAAGASHAGSDIQPPVTGGFTKPR